MGGLTMTWAEPPQDLCSGLAYIFKTSVLECDVVWHDVLSARPDLVV